MQNVLGALNGAIAGYSEGQKPGLLREDTLVKRAAKLGVLRRRLPETSGGVTLVAISSGMLLLGYLGYRIIRRFRAKPTPSTGDDSMV